MYIHAERTLRRRFVMLAVAAWGGDLSACGPIEGESVVKRAGYWPLCDRRFLCFSLCEGPVPKAKLIDRKS